MHNPSDSHGGGHGHESPPYDPEAEERRLEDEAREVGRELTDFWLDLIRGRDAYTPWLFIRYADGDIGLRPLPNGLPFWASPDIWVESSDPNGNAVADEENVVWARVFNLGKAAASPVKVDFYWANPALGLGPADMNLIGTEWVEIKAHASHSVKCTTPWVPTFVNGGHECLMVNCSDPALDPITAPFAPTLDRHVGQRNVYVSKAPAGLSLNFQVELNNLLAVSTSNVVFARAAHLSIDEVLRRTASPAELSRRLAFFGVKTPNAAEMQAMLRPGTPAYDDAVRAAPLSSVQTAAARDFGGTRALGYGGGHRGCLARLLKPWALFTAEGGAAAGVKGSVSEGRKRIPSGPDAKLSARLTEARGLLADGRGIPREGFRELVEIEMESLESRRLDLELNVPAGAREGEHVVFQLDQWAEGMSLGGYTIVVEVGGRKAQQED